MVLDAYTTLATTETDPHRALTRLQDAIEIDPYNADLHHRAATILTQIGDYTAADRLIDRYNRRLTTAGLDTTSHHHAPP
ncbi:tetratricopeptide repeat protein [Micromonospora sp. NPDC047793]|uniref:tetratricopeptide repeat protein n=1 Tax=Micromonospora sp. NPDC047793 TaxID=3154342 RepID=UPI0033D74786